MVRNCCICVKTNPKPPRVGLRVTVGVGLGVSVGGSVYFPHSLYTKAFQKNRGGSFQKLYEHAAQG